MLHRHVCLTELAVSRTQCNCNQCILRRFTPFVFRFQAMRSRRNTSDDLLGMAAKQRAGAAQVPADEQRDGVRHQGGPRVALHPSTRQLFQGAFYSTKFLLLYCHFHYFEINRTSGIFLHLIFGLIKWSLCYPPYHSLKVETLTMLCKD